MKGVNVLLCVISMQIAFFPPRSFFCFKNNGTEHNMRLFIHSTIVCCAVLFMLQNIILSRVSTQFDSRWTIRHLYIGNGSLYGSLHSTAQADTDTHFWASILMHIFVVVRIGYVLFSFFLPFAYVWVCVCVLRPMAKMLHSIFWREFLLHLTITNMKYNKYDGLGLRQA